MLPILSADKANHAVYGSVVALAGAAISPWLHILPWQGALIACVAVAALKELWDRHTRRGAAEWPDFYATCAGGLPCVVSTWSAAP